MKSNFSFTSFKTHPTILISKANGTIRTKEYSATILTIECEERILTPLYNCHTICVYIKPK